MVMMVVVIMAVAVVAAVAMPAVAIPAVVMPTVAAMVNATATMVVVNATVTMVAIEMVGLGPRHCQCRAKPGPGIRLIRRVVIDIHAQADREGECGYGVFHSK
jgi:hypothetical protein